MTAGSVTPARKSCGVATAQAQLKRRGVRVHRSFMLKGSLMALKPSAWCSREMAWSQSRTARCAFCVVAAVGVGIGQSQCTSCRRKGRLQIG